MTDDGPVYHALEVHLCRAKLITHFDDRSIVVKFSKSRVWDSSRGKYLYFWRYHNFLITQCLRKLLCQKPARFVHPFWWNSDLWQTDRQDTDTVAWVKIHTEKIMLSCFLKYNYLHEIIENIHVHSWIRFLERTTNRMQTMSSYLENRLTIYVLCTLYRVV